jgi:hypothetical protein
MEIAVRTNDAQGLRTFILKDEKMRDKERLQ